MRSLLLVLFLLPLAAVHSQSAFSYQPYLQAVTIPGMPGIHSFAHAQHQGKFLVIGGRLDGIHARQPFNAFPASMNNANLVVIEPATGNYWTAPATALPVAVAEQLQSTNMNYTQAGDTLYLVGGYSFSASANDHITHQNLITVQVSGLIQAIVNNQPVAGYFKHTSDTLFHNTGGQLAYLNGQFYLVGGQVFTGRYNPMGHATYTQTYLSRVVKFTVNNQGSTPTFQVEETWSDPAHLRRRDYNLLPQIDVNGNRGFMISSGVFQPVTDLPFLYPVEIRDTGYTARQDFSQLFSNYHSARAVIMDTVANECHSIFFGGMAQYYMLNGVVTQDNLVPFVKTISLVTRKSDGTYHESAFPQEMPGYKGAGSEFFPLQDDEEIFFLDSNGPDTVLIGHMLGGIQSSSINPFSSNQTAQTSADAGLWKVFLVKTAMGQEEQKDEPKFKLYPNPGRDKVYLHAKDHMDGVFEVQWMNSTGQRIATERFTVESGETWQRTLELPREAGTYFLRIFCNDVPVVSEQIQRL